MFRLIKQVFIVLLIFSSTLARAAKFGTKCLSLNDKPPVFRLLLI